MVEWASLRAMNGPQMPNMSLLFYERGGGLGWLAPTPSKSIGILQGLKNQNVEEEIKNKK